MANWKTALPDWRVIDRGASLFDRYSLSYWDAMLIAACIEAGATALYSEGFSAYGEMDGLKIVNPFAMETT